MKERMQASGKMHVIMKVRAFSKEDGTRPFYELKAEVMKDSTNYYSQMGDTDMLMNATFLVMVDHRARQIVWNKSTPVALRELKDPMTTNIDSLLMVFGKASYDSNDKELDHYRIVHANGSIRQTDMYFNKASNLLTRIEYTYQSSQRVYIEFERFDLQPAFNAEIFSERKYLNVINGKWKAAPNYSNYQIINNTMR